MGFIMGSQKTLSARGACSMGSLVVVVAQERILFLLINIFVFHFPRIGILLLGVIPIINTVVLLL